MDQATNEAHPRREFVARPHCQKLLDEYFSGDFKVCMHLLSAHMYGWVTCNLDTCLSLSLWQDSTARIPIDTPSSRLIGQIVLQVLHFATQCALPTPCTFHAVHC